MGQLIIGVDPHKRSATIEIINEREQVLARGRYGTDTGGYQQLLAAGRRHAGRVWAVEGCNGIGRHLAQRLVADGETVLDVPAKLAAKARNFDTGHGRKTDGHDAHHIAVTALRTRACTRFVPTAPPSRCGCWPTAATSSAPPAPRPSTGCTSYCSN
ncbi:hypothetical protein GCM10023107_04110 [Actinoplanes octamycinicus]|uniref:IS110 family transposase n=1 Tax=Actinoplanes octamycinicus TaxID=135948 RepID=UPI0031EBFA66